MSGEGRRVVVCKTLGCEQILATIGERGDVYPVIMGAFIDAEGRVTVVCPACKERNRLPTRRQAA